MKLSLSPPPYADAPVVVLISGLGGSGSYWLPQLAVLEQEYQVVCYDQRGTGRPQNIPTTPEAVFSCDSGSYEYNPDDPPANPP